MKVEADGAWFSVKLRACTSLGCPCYQGFVTIEAVTDDKVFRSVLRKAEREIAGTKSNG